MKPYRTIRAWILAVLLLGWVSPAAAVHEASSREDLSRWMRKRPRIERITVVGNRALKDSRIREVMETKSAGVLARVGFRKRPRLVRTALRRDEQTIRHEYRRHGYWDATVRIAAVPGESDEVAHVTVTIEEGPQSFWGTVTVEGDHAELVDRISKFAHQLPRGKPADSLRFAYVRAVMRSECGDYAHPAARVAVNVSRRLDSLDVRFRLTAGPEVVLGELSVEGLEHTRRYVVERELGLRPGEPFSRKRLDEKQQNVYATGLFTFVRLEPSYSDSSGSDSVRTADLSLRVVERRPSFVGVRTGAGQDEERDLTWDYALEWGSRNWLGTGRKWTLTAESGFVVVTEWRVIHHRFSARYVEPWILGMRLPTSLELAYEPRVQAQKTLDYKRASVALNITRRYRRVYRIWSSLVYDRSEIIGAPPERQQELLEREGISITRRWTASLERDTRPNLFVPTAGARTRLDLQYVGGFLGGENDFYKVDFSWARYQIISAPSVFASRIRIGWTGLHSGGEFVPALDRFDLGGANSIRGYTENTVGPTDSLGASLGGKVVTLLNLELRTPVSQKIWFTLFGDIGNNWESFREVSLDRMLLSIGIGWQYLAPVGPLRLDYARRVLHPGHPTSDRIHLSILFSF